MSEGQNALTIRLSRQAKNNRSQQLSSDCLPALAFPRKPRWQARRIQSPGSAFFLTAREGRGTPAPPLDGGQAFAAVGREFRFSCLRTRAALPLRSAGLPRRVPSSSLTSTIIIGSRTGGQRRFRDTMRKPSAALPPRWIWRCCCWDWTGPPAEVRNSARRQPVKLLKMTRKIARQIPHYLGIIHQPVKIAAGRHQLQARGPTSFDRP